MKQKDILRAYSSLIALNALKLPVKKAYAIYKLFKTVDTQYQFISNESKKSIDRHSGELNSDGMVKFKDEDECVECKKELNELNDMDVDVEIPPVELSEEDLAGQTISPADIYNLEGFVTFV